MATPPTVETTRADYPLPDEPLGEDVVSATPEPIIAQKVERFITPIQQPYDSEASMHRSRFGDLTGAANPPNSAFAVLRATTIQQTIGHPLAYVRVLMQLGYEPLAATRGKNLFGKEVYFYPNVFRYMRYIYNTDGFFGLYRGFGCSLASKIVCWYATTKADEILNPAENRLVAEPEILTWNKCIQKTLKEIRCQSWGILASQPFQVMAIRSMAQFIGREKGYSSFNIFQNLQEIYRQEGIGGFFVGLVPRWLLEVSTIILSNVIIHALKTNLTLQKEVTALYDYIGAMLAQTITYPLSVITTVTMVNRSGLLAGGLPLSPGFTHWQDVYKYLSKTDQLKRGSSLFNRAVQGTTGIPAPGTPIPNA